MTKGYILLIMQVFLFTAVSLAQADFDYLSEGDMYHAKFDNFNAAASYEKALKDSPNSYLALSKLTLACNDAGEELLDLKNRNEAQGYIERAVNAADTMQKKFPDSALTYTYLALSYGNIAMFKGGKEKIKYAFKVKLNAEKAIQMNPHDVFPYIIMGIYYREAARLNWFEKIFAKSFLGGVPEGTFEESKQMFYKALSIDPNIIIAYYHLSKTFRYMDDNKDELYCLDKVIQLPTRNFRDKYAKIKADKRLEELKN